MHEQQALFNLNEEELHIEAERPVSDYAAAAQHSLPVTRISEAYADTVGGYKTFMEQGRLYPPIPPEPQTKLPSRIGGFDSVNGRPIRSDGDIKRADEARRQRQDEEVRRAIPPGISKHGRAMLDAMKKSLADHPSNQR